MSKTSPVPASAAQEADWPRLAAPRCCPRASCVALVEPVRRHSGRTLAGLVFDIDHNRERGVIELDEREGVCGALGRWRRWRRGIWHRWQRRPGCSKAVDLATSEAASSRAPARGSGWPLSGPFGALSRAQSRVLRRRSSQYRALPRDRLTMLGGARGLGVKGGAAGLIGGIGGMELGGIGVGARPSVGSSVGIAG